MSDLPTDALWSISEVERLRAEVARKDEALSDAEKHMAFAAEHYPQYFGVGKHITDARTVIRAALAPMEKKNG